MTEQKPDYFIYDHFRFIIIDIERGKRPHEEFVQMPTSVRESTDCYRGFVAQYHMEDGRLFGQQIFDDGKSPNTPLHYTGSMLIAWSPTEFWTTDFLQCYLDAEEAYELYFEDGILKVTRVLTSVIAEAKTIRKSRWWISDLVSPVERRETMDEFCRLRLQASYGYNTYRWQNDNIKDEDAYVTEYFRNLEERKRRRKEDYEAVHKLCSYLPLLRKLKGNYLMKNPDPKDKLGYDARIPKDDEAARKCWEFFHLGYESPLWDREYNIHVVPLLNYYPEREKAQLHANREEICALLTLELRTDYWCNGAFDGQIEDGTYISLLENLERIIEETYHPWKKTDFRTGDIRFIGMKDTTADESLPPDDEDESSGLMESLTRPQMGNVLRIIDETYVAGASYVELNEDEYRDRFFGCRQLRLVLEPGNQHDKKAVRIEDKEQVKLGYLPRAENDIPYRLLNGGYRLYAYPLTISSKTKGQEYRICVYMDVLEPGTLDLYQEAVAAKKKEKETLKQDLIRRFYEVLKMDGEKAMSEAKKLLAECDKIDIPLSRQFSEGFLDHFHNDHKY